MCSLNPTQRCSSNESPRVPGARLATWGLVETVETVETYFFQQQHPAGKAEYSWSGPWLTQWWSGTMSSSRNWRLGVADTSSLPWEPRCFSSHLSGDGQQFSFCVCWRYRGPLLDTVTVRSISIQDSTSDTKLTDVSGILRCPQSL